MKNIVYLLVLCFAITGCAGYKVRIIGEEIERKDQNITTGNRGVVVGSPALLEQPVSKKDIRYEIRIEEYPKGHIKK
ncbi:hypothetical protein B9J78_06055 [bacterium Unc6]|nr:hypothetical protein [bacterium Unc6]